MADLYGVEAIPLAARIFAVADVFDDEEDHFHIVSCENKACPANVCAVGKTGEEAAALWNTRNGGAA